MTDLIDDFHKHEVLDRLHVLRSNLYEHLESHPFMLHYPEIKNVIDIADTYLEEAYQLVGRTFNA